MVQVYGRDNEWLDNTLDYLTGLVEPKNGVWKIYPFDIKKHAPATFDAVAAVNQIVSCVQSLGGWRANAKVFFPGHTYNTTKYAITLNEYINGQTGDLFIIPAVSKLDKSDSDHHILDLIENIL